MHNTGFRDVVFLTGGYGSAIAIGLVLIGRISAVYPLSAVFARTALKVDMRHQHVLVWGGLRGALALALALAVPNTIPEKGAIIIAAFAVVAFSIFAQGVTMPWLIQTLGLSRHVDTDGHKRLPDKLPS